MQLKIMVTPTESKIVHSREGSSDVLSNCSSLYIIKPN